MLCIGIDLSWTGRRPSGFAVIDPAAGSLRSWTAILSPSDVARWLNGLGSAVAGIDAPLVLEPSRSAEADLRRTLGRFGVGAFQAGEGFLERHGLQAGPALAALLRAAGWVLAPPPVTCTGNRHAFETFPRGLAVTLLGASRPPEYKRGPIADRARGLGQYRDLLRRTLTVRGLRLDVELPGSEAGGCPAGRLLKELEDRLDAIACALAALEVAENGASPADRFGDPLSGEIVLPGASRLTSARAPSSP
ncbi:MAG: hypothetical protein KatS3mg062_0227 [Tepidiforma sp.]|nr:MAG: hypothetical protein KatS3mg062_0227 [Tepidiforma sp.]